MEEQCTTLRVCAKCTLSKPVTDFYRAANRKSGYDPYCKTCNEAVRTARRKRYQQDGTYVVPAGITCWKCGETKPPADFHRDYSLPTGYSAKCKECKKRDRAIQYRLDPGASYRAVRKCKLKKTYGLTIDAYNQMLADQGGKCAICGKEPDGRNLVVDHDHETNAVRGLLCGPCNRGIGMLQDSPEVLEVAVAYLRKARTG